MTLVKNRSIECEWSNCEHCKRMAYVFPDAFPFCVCKWETEMTEDQQISLQRY